MDIFERIRRQYEAWKLEQKYMKRRKSRVMRKSPPKLAHSKITNFLGDVIAVANFVESSYKYDNGDYVPAVQPPSPAASERSNPLSLKNRRSWIGK